MLKYTVSLRYSRNDKFAKTKQKRNCFVSACVIL